MVTWRSMARRANTPHPPRCERRISTRLAFAPPLIGGQPHAVRLVIQCINRVTQGADSCSSRRLSMELLYDPSRFTNAYAPGRSASSSSSSNEARSFRLRTRPPSESRRAASGGARRLVGRVRRGRVRAEIEDVRRGDAASMFRPVQRGGSATGRCALT